jgi:D-3-phosphoglycerate dehydrogenase
VGKKILTFNQISVKGLERLSPGQYEIASEFTSPDAILLRSHKLQPEEIAASVQCIARAGAGVNNIPVAECTKRGIPVFNTPGANANAVKELVASGLLLGSRGIYEGIMYANSLGHMTDTAELNRTLEAHKKNFKGHELRGRTLGVVGLGAIGSMVAEMALTLGMDVIGYDPALSIEAAWRLSNNVRRADSLQQVFAKSDFVSLHVPAIPATRGLVDSDLLESARQGCVLLNFARQEIVDHEAVIAALDAGRLRKYISDFPAPGLIGRSDVILMPHIGASTEEAEDNCAVMAVDQLKEFLENGSIRNSVNFPAVELEHVTGCRLAVTNDNVPKILNSVLAILAEQNVNVIDMLNKSRDEVAYNLIDINAQPPVEVLTAMRQLDGVSSVRVIGNCS